jgi:hypothetical protein
MPFETITRNYIEKYKFGPYKKNVAPTDVSMVPKMNEHFICIKNKTIQEFKMRSS